MFVVYLPFRNFRIECIIGDIFPWITAQWISLFSWDRALIWVHIMSNNKISCTRLPLECAVDKGITFCQPNACSVCEPETNSVSQSACAQRAKRKQAPVAVATLRLVANESGPRWFTSSVRKTQLSLVSWERGLPRCTQNRRGDHVLAVKEERRKGKKEGKIGREDCGFEALSRQELGSFCLRVADKQSAGCCDGPVLRSPIRHCSLEITALKQAADVRHENLHAESESQKISRCSFSKPVAWTCQYLRVICHVLVAEKIQSFPKPNKIVCLLIAHFFFFVKAVCLILLILTEAVSLAVTSGIRLFNCFSAGNRMRTGGRA